MTTQIDSQRRDGQRGPILEYIFLVIILMVILQVSTINKGTQKTILEGVTQKNTKQVPGVVAMDNWIPVQK